MTIQVQCGGCRKTIKAPDSMAGKSANCPACGLRITVPAAQAALSTPAAEKQLDSVNSSALSEQDWLRDLEDAQALEASSTRQPAAEAKPTAKLEMRPARKRRNVGRREDYTFREASPYDGALFFLLKLSLALLIPSVLLVVEYGAIVKCKNAIASSSWPTTQSQIAQTEIILSRGRRGVKSYIPQVKYSYQVGERWYDGTEIAFYSVKGPESYAKDLIARFSAGSTHPVFYNPEDPSQSVLIPGTYWTNYLTIVLPVILLLAACPSAQSYLKELRERIAVRSLGAVKVQSANVPRRKTSVLGWVGLAFVLLIGAVYAWVWLSFSGPSIQAEKSDPIKVPSRRSNSHHTPNPSRPRPKLELPARVPLRNAETGVMSARVRFPAVMAEPGSGMKLHVYLPEGDHSDKSLPCVFIAPAGTNGIQGISLGSGDRDEHLPYVRAGMAVIAYEIDGLLPGGRGNEIMIGRAYEKLRKAEGGLINARWAIRFALERMPEIDPDRLFAAGHSSAGGQALLLASHDARIKAVMAYAPSTNWVTHMRRALGSFEEHASYLPDLERFLTRQSPITHCAAMTSKVFLFHAQDDGVVPFSDTAQYAERLTLHKVSVNLVQRKSGGHYASMIQEGIPAAIEWLQSSGFLAAPESDSDPRVVAVADNQPGNASSGKAKPPVTKSADPTETSQPDSGSEYQRRYLPKAKSASHYEFLTQADYILGDEFNAKKRMRWLPGAKRPALALRWGMGLYLVNQKEQPKVKGGWHLRDHTGSIGEDLQEALQKRVDENLFGEWPLIGGQFYTKIPLTSGTPKQLKETARQEGIDVLVLFHVSPVISGRYRTRAASLQVEIVDLSGDIKSWTSKKLMSQTATTAIAQELVQTVMNQIDDQFRLLPMELIDRDWVKTRVRELVRRVREKDNPPESLATLCELRFYLAESLLTEDEFHRSCELLIQGSTPEKLLLGPWKDRLILLERLQGK